MKTLVYFASGHIREEYQDLDFNEIYLVDNCFKNRGRQSNNILTKGKITCIGMDCLESIEYLKFKKVKIDCFVSLNEGLYEGGGSYAINSDMFLGYAMPLFNESYIHIMNKNYYHNQYHVTMDLPYNMDEIKENDKRYLNPFIFSKNNYHKGHAKVFQMNRLGRGNFEFSLKQKLNLKIIHDSIWNDYDNLDAVIISFSEQGHRNFFDRIPKVININKIRFEELFDYCEKYKIKKMGCTPFGQGNYYFFLKKLKDLRNDYLEEVSMYHLNKNDYKEIKKFTTNK